MEMEMTSEHRGVKRNRKVVKKMVMFVNSMPIIWDGIKSAGIYEFNIEITTREAEDPSVVVVNSEYIEGTNRPLKPIHLFSDHKDLIGIDGYFRVCSVGSSLFDDSKLYMFPGDFTLKPCIFNFKTGKEEDLPALPQARKVQPIIAVLRNHLFALSTWTRTCYMIPSPDFESLPLLDDDKRQQEWTALNPLYSSADIRGYAVLGEDFILVSLSMDWEAFEFFSYNVQSGLWKPTRDPPAPLPNDTEDFYPQFLYKNALVIGNDIYSFSHYALDLVVFSYTVLHPNNSGAEEEPDISLNGLSTRVRGLDHYWVEFKHISGFNLCDAYPFKRSTAIAKVDEDHGLFCLLHTLLPCSYPDPADKEEVYFTFVQFKSRDSCQIIKTLTCALSVGTDISLLLLESCYVIPVDVEEKQDQHRSKRAAIDTDGEAQEQPSREGWDASQVEASM